MPFTESLFVFSLRKYINYFIIIDKRHKKQLKYTFADNKICNLLQINF